MGLKLGTMLRKVDVQANGHSANSIYHEKQIKELCAMHALNNLLQEKEAFSQKQLDQICQEYVDEYRIKLAFFCPMLTLSYCMFIGLRLQDFSTHIGVCWALATTMLM